MRYWRLVLLVQFNAKKTVGLLLLFLLLCARLKNHGLVWQTNPTFQLAIEVCNAAAEKLQRHVCQHFTSIILQHSEDMREERDFDDIRAGHMLIQHIHKYCSDILLLVIPQLEERQVDDSDSSPCH